ncbi:hypothetical protein FB451DRAFT_1372404 [Mycena latifolia]|nr:hypothetical protein FB451DRAFT_1372404 [Mycena latifolia]
MSVKRCVECGSPQGVDNGEGIEGDGGRNASNPDKLVLRARDLELAAGIDAVDAELARLQAVRDHLSASRQALHSQLSIIPNVPREIWSMIFKIHGELCRAGLPMRSSAGMAVHCPLMPVCREWRDIAVATPSLWSYIALHMGTPLKLEILPVDVAQSVVNLCLVRSRLHALDIVVSTGGADKDIIQYSGILHQLLSESPRILSLVLDIPVLFNVLNGLPGPFGQLRSLNLTNIHWCIRDITDEFWRELTCAPIESLSLMGSDPTRANFAWDKIQELRTDSVDLLMACLADPSCPLRVAELAGHSNAHCTYVHPIRNLTVRSLRVNCNHQHSGSLFKLLQLPQLEELSILNCDHISWADDIGLNIAAFLSYANIKSLTLNVDLSRGERTMQELALSPSLANLRTLHVEDFWTDRDMTPISQEHEHFYEFALHILAPHGQGPILPALETFTYRVHPERFARGAFYHPALKGEVQLMEFLSEIDQFLTNRASACCKLKKCVLKGGGRRPDVFPSFIRRVEEFQRNGMIFEFDERDLDQIQVPNLVGPDNELTVRVDHLNLLQNVQHIPHILVGRKRGSNAPEAGMNRRRTGVQRDDLMCEIRGVSDYGGADLHMSPGVIEQCEKSKVGMTIHEHDLRNVDLDVGVGAVIVVDEGVQKCTISSPRQSDGEKRTQTERTAVCTHFSMTTVSPVVLRDITSPAPQDRNSVKRSSVRSWSRTQSPNTGDRAKASSFSISPTSRKAAFILSSTVWYTTETRRTPVMKYEMSVYCCRGVRFIGRYESKEELRIQCLWEELETGRHYPA